MIVLENTINLVPVVALITLRSILRIEDTGSEWINDFNEKGKLLDRRYGVRKYVCIIIPPHNGFLFNAMNLSA